MGVELQQDDLEVGMYITVLRGRPLYEISLTGTNQCGEDNSFKGDVLKILAVDLPFVVVRCCNSSLTGPITFDVRMYGLKKLSPEYVNSALNRTRK